MKLSKKVCEYISIVVPFLLILLLIHCIFDFIHDIILSLFLVTKAMNIFVYLHASKKLISFLLHGCPVEWHCFLHVYHGTQRIYIENVLPYESDLWTHSNLGIILYDKIWKLPALFCCFPFIHVDRKMASAKHGDIFMRVSSPFLAAEQSLVIIWRIRFIFGTNATHAWAMCHAPFWGKWAKLCRTVTIRFICDKRKPGVENAHHFQHKLSKVTFCHVHYVDPCLLDQFTLYM